MNIRCVVEVEAGSCGVVLLSRPSVLSNWICIYITISKPYADNDIYNTNIIHTQKPHTQIMIGKTWVAIKCGEEKGNTLKVHDACGARRLCVHHGTAVQKWSQLPTESESGERCTERGPVTQLPPQTTMLGDLSQAFYWDCLHTHYEWAWRCRLSFTSNFTENTYSHTAAPKPI